MKARKGTPRIGRGAPGNYVLNQKAPRFADRRTKRNRTRAARLRSALAD